MENMDITNTDMKEEAGQPLAPGQETRSYEFRKLNSTDLFPMIKIVSKIGLDELTDVFEGSFVKRLLKPRENEGQENGKEETDENYLFVGAGIVLKVANKILGHLPSCEHEIYTLLANASGMKVEAVKALPLDTFMEMILEFVTKEEFASFFRAASQYIRRLAN